jgi:hypothetical protein
MDIPRYTTYIPSSNDIPLSSMDIPCIYLVDIHGISMGSNNLRSRILNLRYRVPISESNSDLKSFEVTDTVYCFNIDFVVL